MLRPYRVTTTQGTHTLMARTPATAICSTLELAGPRAQFMSCLQEGDW